MIDPLWFLVVMVVNVIALFCYEEQSDPIVPAIAICLETAVYIIWIAYLIFLGIIIYGQ